MVGLVWMKRVIARPLLAFLNWQVHHSTSMKAIRVVTKEIRKVGLVTLFFLIGFGLILVLKKLFLAQYSIEFTGLSQAVVGAMLAAKVVVVLDHTRFVHQFRRYPRYVSVLYQTSLYTLAVFFLVVCEKVFNAYRDTGTIGSAIEAVIRSADVNHFLAAILPITLVFLGYNTLAAINRSMGDGALFALFFSTPEPDRIDL